MRYIKIQHNNTFVRMNKIIGDNYENFILENLKNQYGMAWLWKDIPEYILYDELIISDYQSYLYLKCDIGIDILVKDSKNDQYIYVQCKNYCSNVICLHDIAGYLAFKIKFPNKITKLYYNGQLSKRITYMLHSSSEYINYPFNNSIIGMHTNDCNDSVFEMRQYQTDAVAMLNNKNRAILSLPCGMGKTYISLLIAKKFNNIIVFTPTKELAQQTLAFFGSNLPTHNKILISCDGCRNISQLRSQLGSNNVITATFKSCDIVNKLLNKILKPFIIIDEYHNLSLNDINRQSNEMYKILHSEHKILFVSATPKYGENTKIFGSTNYTYGWSDAIKNNYINDFKICLPDNQYSSLKFDDFLNMFKIDNSKNIVPNSKLTQKMYFIIRSLLYNGNKKCIVYLTNIEQAKETHKIINWMKGIFNVEIQTNIIDCTTSKNNRKKMIKAFNESNDISILLNVQILNEGIDIPICDSVFITKPNNNIENLVQRMSRCNRKQKNKNASNVYIWCTHKKAAKIIEYINNNTNGELGNKINQLSMSANNINITSVNKNIQSDINLKKNDNDSETSKKNINETSDCIKISFDNNDVKTTDFLKKYSLIDEKFIDNFYGFYDEGKNEYDFVIDLNNIAFWLEVRKDHLKRLLMSNFINNQDFIISKPTMKKKGTGKNNLKIVLLTYTCAKLLCMISKCEKASLVRNHYIELEKLLIKHKDDIVKSLNLKTPKSKQPNR